MDRLASDVAWRWASHEREGLYDDVHPALEMLNAMRLRLGVLSQNRMTGSQLKDDLESLAISRYFTVVLTSEDIECHKLDTRFFIIGSKIIGLKTSEFL